jgi:hypothetical protein
LSLPQEGLRLFDVQLALLNAQEDVCDEKTR